MQGFLLLFGKYFGNKGNLFDGKVYRGYFIIRCMVPLCDDM